MFNLVLIIKAYGVYILQTVNIFRIARDKVESRSSKCISCNRTIDRFYVFFMFHFVYVPNGAAIIYYWGCMSLKNFHICLLCSSFMRQFISKIVHHIALPCYFLVLFFEIPFGVEMYTQVLMCWHSRDLLTVNRIYGTEFLCFPVCNTHNMWFAWIYLHPIFRTPCWYLV